MPSRDYVTDPNVLLAEGKMLVNSTDDAKFQHKVELVNLVLAGLMPSFLSEYSGESKNTITGWVKTADEEGFDALRVKKQPGRPPKLTSEQLEAIKAVLLEDDPKSHGFNVWDGPSLKSYLESAFSVRLGTRQCQRLFHTLGFSLVRPQTFPGKDEANEKSREDFKKKSQN